MKKYSKLNQFQDIFLQGIEISLINKNQTLELYHFYLVNNFFKVLYF